MPDNLRYRALEAYDGGQITPERLCYSLMAGIWSNIEVAYILATTPRAPIILAGGSDPQLRLARSAETEICRAALMTGMLLRRLEIAIEPAESSATVHLHEDWRLGTNWAVRSELVDRIRQIEPCFPRSARGLPAFPSDSGRTLLNDFHH